MADVNVLDQIRAQVRKDQAQFRWCDGDRKSGGHKWSYDRESQTYSCECGMTAQKSQLKQYTDRPNQVTLSL